MIVYVPKTYMSMTYSDYGDAITVTRLRSITRLRDYGGLR